MHMLVIVIAGLFTNGTTGDQVAQYGLAPDLIQCANAINDARHPIQGDDGTYWYLIAAQCIPMEQQ